MEVGLFGFMKHKNVLTPNIDKLAKKVLYLHHTMQASFLVVHQEQLC